MIMEPVILADAVQIFGVTLVGVSTATAVKLGISAVLLAAVAAVRVGARSIIPRLLGGAVADTRRFWARQGIQVVAAVVVVIGLLSIWITPDTDVTTGVGLLSAGLAFALQQVITAFAGYFVILRGDTFTVGDRVTLGGVRGDVIRLGFLKTTIMEMAPPPRSHTPIHRRGSTRVSTPGGSSR